MFVFAVNISIDLYVGYWGIESDVRGGGRGHKSFLPSCGWPCSVENNLLELFNLGENLPRSNRATTKSMLTSLLLLQIKGGSLIKY
jgi:hypothetical protein